MKIQELLQNQKYTQKRVLENLICHFLDISREKLRTSLEQTIEESILNLDKMVVKSGYAKCDMQYNEMPEALKYTIFGNSTKQATDYRQMTVGINGRTNKSRGIALKNDLLNRPHKRTIPPTMRRNRRCSRSSATSLGRIGATR